MMDGLYAGYRAATRVCAVRKAGQCNGEDDCKRSIVDVDQKSQSKFYKETLALIQGDWVIINKVVHIFKVQFLNEDIMKSGL